jgi:hypothetical protein
MKKYELVKRELMAVERAAWWNPQVRRMLRAAPLVVLFLLLNTRGAHAACSFNPTPDPTVDGSANSLRAAIQAANASGQDCLIELQAGTYTLSIKNTNGQENNAAEGDLDITDSGHTVTIQGQGTKASTVNGGGVNGIDDRVFQVLGGANAVFSKLTIKGGVANDDGTAGAQPGSTESDGGGVLVQDGGHVTLSHVWVNGNQALGNAGANGVSGTYGMPATPGAPGEFAAGGVLFLSAGTVDLTDSKMSGNDAMGGTGGSGGYGASTRPGAGGAAGVGAGGGLYVRSGTANLTDLKISGNSATGGNGGMGGRGFSCYGAPGGVGGAGIGAALYVLSGDVRLSRSAVSGNQATGGLGGVGGFCTIDDTDNFGPSGNGGAAQGAGLFVGTGALDLGQTTVSDNSATGGRGGSAACFYMNGAPGSGGSSLGAGVYAGGGSHQSR